MEVGKRYCIVMTFGWGLVGLVKELTGLNDVLMDDCHFITKCGDNRDWGQFMRDGAGPGAIVNRMGEITVNLDHRIFSGEFAHALPKSR